VDYNKISGLLRYDVSSGDVFWTKDRQGHVKSGDRAGTKQKNKNGKSYITIKVSGKHYLAHRVAWLLHYKIPPELFIDHIDGNGLNNKIGNLREVSRTENQRNQKLSSRSKSGVMGVSKDKKSGKWLVRIGSRDNLKRLGYYSDFFEAVCARKSAEKIRGYHFNHGQNRPL